MANLETNINQVNSDFQKIKTALIDSGVEITDGTRTSEYGEKVRGLYEAGQKSMVDESKIIEKTVVGTNMLLIDDVSEIPLETTINLFSDTITDFNGIKVKITGRNICPSFYETGVVNVNGATITIDEDGRMVINGKPSSGKVFELITDRIYLTEGQIYYVCSDRDSGAPVLSFKINDSETSIASENESYIAKKGDYISSIRFTIAGGTTYDNKKFCPMISVGTRLRSYEKYFVNEYVSNSVGIVSGVRLYCPCSVITTSADGIGISMTYNKSYGMQAEYDRFWDAYQQNGNRTNYEGAFYGTGWTQTIFKPKYDITVTGSAYNIFRACKLSVDLVQLLDGLGVTFDLSKSNNLQYAFYGSAFTHIGVVDTTTSPTLNNTFNSAGSLVTIDKLILKSEGDQTFTNAFNGCRSLENITIEGTIGDGINFSYSPLSHDSLISIITHLADTTGASTKPVLTIGTTNYEKLTAEEIKIATDKGWEVV